eukprot:4136829-Amphidinium_carterae.1
MVAVVENTEANTPIARHLGEVVPTSKVDFRGAHITIDSDSETLKQAACTIFFDNVLNQVVVVGKSRTGGYEILMFTSMRSDLDPPASRSAFAGGFGCQLVVWDTDLSSNEFVDACSQCLNAWPLLHQRGSFAIPIRLCPRDNVSSQSVWKVQKNQCTYGAHHKSIQLRLGKTGKNVIHATFVDG